MAWKPSCDLSRLRRGGIHGLSAPRKKAASPDADAGGSFGSLAGDDGFTGSRHGTLAGVVLGCDITFRVAELEHIGPIISGGSAATIARCRVARRRINNQRAQPGFFLGERQLARGDSRRRAC